MDDGLALWFDTISHSRVIPRPLFLMYPIITKILQESTEYTKITMKILEQYLILGGQEFLKVKEISNNKTQSLS